MATAPKTASFQTPGILPPNAQEMQQLGLEQQMLLEALQQSKDVTAPVQDSGVFKTLNFSGVGNSIAHNAQRRELENSRKKSLDVQGAYSSKLVEALKKFNASDKSNPAVLDEALTNEFPEIRSRAEEEKKRQDDLVKALLPKASLASGQASAARGVGALLPKEDFHVSDGSVIRTREGESPGLVAGGFTPGTLPTGEAIDTNALTGRRQTVSRAPQISLNNTGPGLVHEKIKGLEAAQMAAVKFGDTIRSTEQSLNALASGAQTGFGEDWKQNARTFVSGLTGIKFDASAPTAVLAKALAENVVNEFGGKLGTGVSNADVQFMQRASGGLETDPTALERILAIRAAAAIRRIRSHNEQVGVLGDLPDNRLGGEATRKLYSVERPSFAFVFKTPEARASFESGISRRPFEEVLKQERATTPAVKDWRKDEAERQRRLKALMGS